MSEYQVLARKYRPQVFSSVVGQEAIVTTLKNAIKNQRLAHAYLFCGLRGTGKTTLARLFAKALNCLNPTANLEPCNQCSSCKEITSGSSLDVLEIDGASHRGIDDIRQINDTVGYSTASGKYKIYIIDEVHMLTKEAFNALLKTLEEPPPKVKFFFATTEPHKIPPTILSRCQRFNLNRIPLLDIVKKLQQITAELGANVSEEALRLIANRSEGGLRDAESLLDQILAFHEGEISAQSVADVLGIMTRESLFLLDQAGKDNNLAVAFDIAEQVFSQGKDVGHFIESITEHFRTILMVKLSGKDAPFLTLTSAEREMYQQSSKFYTQEQCLHILDFLIEAQNQRFNGAERIMLEALLLRILRSHQRIPIEMLIKRIAELEQRSPKALEPSQPQLETENSLVEAPRPATKAAKKSEVLPDLTKQEEVGLSITEDPTPSKADLGIREKAKPKPRPIENASAPIELGARLTEEAKAANAEQQRRYDTLLQFATVELEGTIRKKSIT